MVSAIKQQLKRLAFWVSPQLATELQSARGRALSQRQIVGWGCPAVTEKLIARFGSKVIAGPFKGLTLSAMTRAEQLGPFLLGTYERELHPAWELIFQGRYGQIIDVGAKFGYYAVGLARHFPASEVVAFDTDWWARKALREMMRANQVRNVVVRHYCTPPLLSRSLAEGALVVSDAEGYEGILFGCGPIAQLASAVLLIETHDFVIAGLTEQIARLLSATHAIVSIPTEPGKRAVAVDLSFLTPSERPLAVDEVRPEQQWLLCLPRRGPNQHLREAAGPLGWPAMSRVVT